MRLSGGKKKKARSAGCQSLFRHFHTRFFVYEGSRSIGSRSIVGPYLSALQATGTAVGIVTGFGR
jgi:hypothetical protein